MPVEEVLNRIKEELKTVIPADIRITDIEFEGAELVIYTKDPEKFAEKSDLIKQLAKKLQKRIVVRADPSKYRRSGRKNKGTYTSRSKIDKRIF